MLIPSAQRKHLLSKACREMEVMTRLDTKIDFLLKGSVSGLLFVLLPKLFLFGPRPPILLYVLPS